MAKLIITLNDELTEKYLQIASSKLTAEVDNDIEPSGTSLTIDIGLFAGLVELESFLVNGQEVKFNSDEFDAVNVSLENDEKQN